MNNINTKGHSTKLLQNSFAKNCQFSCGLRNRICSLLTVSIPFDRVKFRMTTFAQESTRLSCWLQVVKFLPPANEICGKVMFLHVSVILSRRGVRAMHAPLLCTPPSTHAPHHACPSATHAPCQTCPPPRMPPPTIWSMSGRYASYWNAPLLTYILLRSLIVEIQ